MYGTFAPTKPPYRPYLYFWNTLFIDYRTWIQLPNPSQYNSVHSHFQANRINSQEEAYWADKVYQKQKGRTSARS